MSYIIAMVQCTSRDTCAENLLLAEERIRETVLTQARLIVFPEYFMVPYTLTQALYVNAAQPLNGSFVTGMQTLARRYGMWLIFGMNEKAFSDCTKTYNTTVILDDQGMIRGTYRKTHLFDAFHFMESDRTIPGEQFFAPVDTPFGKIGLGMCYDLRFPELARHAALAGAELLLYPSAWVKGDLKSNQWKTLLGARAIENGIFVAGCNQYSQHTYMGESQIIDPFGTTITGGGSGESLVLGVIDLDQIQRVRSLVPALSHRRPHL